MKLALAAEMQELDRKTIEEFGVPGIVLMENAGHGTFAFMENKLGSFAETTVVIFIGPGNNGGDGLVIARRIHMAGGHPLLLFASPPQRLRNDAAINYEITKQLGLPFLELTDPLDTEGIADTILHSHAQYPVACLVDALFGTGLARDICGHLEQVILLLNRFHHEYSWPVVAVDLPSGINADSGQVLGVAVEADLTVTYGLAKPAHVLHGRSKNERLHIVDIGIPSALVQQAALKGSIVTETIRKKLPARLLDSHKGSHGHLLVLGGSAGKTGAAILSCQGALRSGCGLVTAAVPHELNSILENNLIEAMTIPLPASTISLSDADYDFIYRNMEGMDAVVLGPGIGLDEKTRALVVRLYQKISLPMVVDADALNILALQQNILANPGGDRVLTPHPGEMSRLTGQTTTEIQKDRIAAALRLCQKSACEVVTVLKGAGTIIANGNGNWAINTTGNQGMAAGGMGDVLAGLIGGLLSQGLAPWDAARAGVYLHGLAADRLQRKTTYGYTASEVAETLPYTINGVD